MSILKSDLTYSISGGFLLGALALFFMQPVSAQSEMQQNLSATLSSATQILG